MQIQTQQKNIKINVSGLQKGQLPLIDRNIASGNFLAWVKKRAKPLEKFKDSNELFKADIELTNLYKSERMNLYLRSLNKEPLSFHDDFETCLEKMDLYSSSKIGLNDRKLTQEFIKSRFEAYEELCRSPEESPQPKVNPLPPVSEPEDKKTEVELPPPPKAEDPHRAVFNAVNELKSAEVVPEQEVPSQVVKEEVPVRADQQIIFPALFLVKEALKNKEEKYNKLIKYHKITYDDLQNSYKEKARAEKEVRQFDDEKYPYVSRFMAIPAELKAKLDQANDVLVAAENLRRGCAQDFFRVQHALAGVISNNYTHVRKVSPDESQRNREYIMADEDELQKKYKKLDDQLIKYEVFRDNLRSEIQDSVLNTSVIEEGLTKINSADFEGLEKILPKEIEIYILGEPVKVRTKKWLQAIRKSLEEVNKLKAELNQVSPETLLQSEKNLREELLIAYRKNRTLVRRTESKEKEFSSGYLQKLEDNDMEIRARERTSGERYYKAIIEKTSFESDQYLDQKLILNLLLGELQKTEGPTSKEELLKMFLDASYSNVRKCGQEIPNVSITGIAHSPDQTLARATRRSGEVLFASSEETKGWVYRTIPKHVMDMRSANAIFPYRYSCRVIASPKLINEMDELTARYDFLYKVPNTADAWDREDALTIYMDNEPDKAQMLEVASVVEKYVYEGPDSEMLGQRIEAYDGSVFRGITFLETPTLFEIGDAVSLAYQIDNNLGKAVSEYFDVKEKDGHISYGSSPGKLKAVQRFVDDLMTRFKSIKE